MPAGSSSSTSSNLQNPLLTPGQPPDSTRGLIPIQSSRGSTPHPGPVADPYAYWLKYYAAKDPKRASPELLHQSIRELNRMGKPRDVHAALLGYLTNHPTLAEPWMYEALALAITMNKGSETDVKTALNYAADLALRTHNPNHLVSVADVLFMKGYYDRVGTLLDEAAAKVPHRFEPLVGSVNLAQKTKDPKRMARSVESLLSLGWPGRDDYFRLESRGQVETLEKSLREENRTAEADALVQNLAESEARDLFVRLTWDGESDFDLAVEEPLGATACYQTPRTVFGGAIVKNGYGSHPEEVYTCPRGFDGYYTLTISTIWTNPSRPTTRLNLEIIQHEGTPREVKQSYKLSPDKPNDPIKINLTGGRRKTVLPYFDPTVSAQEAFSQLRKANPSRGSAKHPTTTPRPNPAQATPKAASRPITVD